MIYKVFYQESAVEVPVREKTKVLYIEAESERDVRTKLLSQGYHFNVELIQALAGAHLEYEKNNAEKFELLEIK